MVSKRMTNEERRSQLLRTAFEIVSEEGTEALTLARVAERAGVTKPIAYDHFGTRSGLLIAMYEDYDRKQTEAMHAALAEGGETIGDVAEILSAAYIDCAVSCGPENGAITAALAGTQEMEELLQSCRAAYMEDCRNAFAPFVEMEPQELSSIMVGIVGAAEALSQSAAAGRMTRNEAVRALSSMMVGALVKQSEH